MKTPIKSSPSTNSRLLNSRLLIVSVVVLATVTGCSDRISKAEKEMEAIRNSPSQPIEEPPRPEPVEDFVYTVGDKRSPFIAPSASNVGAEAQEDSDIQPDITREKEELEQFELSTLTYQGMVTAPNGEDFGLIQRPDGAVASVKVGDHMGVNFGRVVEITPTQINLIEIVPGDRSGFVEKAQSLVSPD